MKNINTIILEGNLVNDLTLNQGETVGKFTIACNDSIKNRGGEWESFVNYFDVNVFGNTAKNLNPYLKKGKKVIVLGKLKQDRWEKNGQKFSRIVVNANEISLFSNGSNQNNKTASQTNDDFMSEYTPF